MPVRSEHEMGEPSCNAEPVYTSEKGKNNEERRWNLKVLPLKKACTRGEPEVREKALK